MSHHFVSLPLTRLSAEDRGVQPKVFTSHFLVPMVLLLLPAGLSADLLAPDFEGFPDGTVLSDQYPGLTFSSATILTAGIGLNEFEFPPFSGINVVFDDGGPITITFDSPVSSFAGHFTYFVSLTMTAFDASNNPVDQALSLFNSNLACLAGPPCFGDPGSGPNELLQVMFSGGISSVTIVGDPGGFSFTMDGPTPVPEPSSLSLLFLGIISFVGLKRLTTRL